MRSTFDLSGARRMAFFIQILDMMNFFFNHPLHRAPGQSSNRNITWNRNALVEWKKWKYERWLRNDIDNAHHAGHKQCANEHKFPNEPRDQWVKLNENKGRRGKKTSRRSILERDADDDEEKRKMIFFIYFCVYEMRLTLYLSATWITKHASHVFKF